MKLFSALFGVVCVANAMDYYVTAGSDFQSALNAAAPGDNITLQAGATFTGNFVLPKKTGTGWVTIQSSALTSLPADRRVKPADAIHMPKLISPTASSVLRTAPGAHHYRLIGLHLGSAAGVYTFQVVSIGLGTETDVNLLPSDIEIDRCYIHGDPRAGGKRGVALNARNTSVTNSYISDFKSTNQDAQAVAGYNGPGPFRIENNYLEASGENIMFGGAVPAIQGVVPSDIVVRRNHLFKPLTWRIGSPTYAGTAWLIKNIFELKNARRVLVDGNVMENNWLHAQNGYAILFTVRTENGRVPWAVVEDVTFRNNIVRHAGSGVNVLGHDGAYGGVTRRICIVNNLFEDINGTNWGGYGDFLQLTSAPQNVAVDHNTILQQRMIAFFSVPSTGFVYRNNISVIGGGIAGNGKGSGLPAIAYYAPGSVIAANVMAAGSAAMYPAGNYFPSSIYDVQFTNAFASNYLLDSNSPYLGHGTDGKDLGADVTVINSLTAGVVQ